MIAIVDLAYDDDGRGAPCVAGETYRSDDPTAEVQKGGAT